MKTNKFGSYDEYVLSSDSLEVSVITLGATVRSLRFRGRELLLGYPDASGYESGSCYCGAVAGRYANRIAGGRITVGGKKYLLDLNDGNNHLHGGFSGFDKKVFTAAAVFDNTVRLEYRSPDGEGGYPGNLTAAVTYTVCGDGFTVTFSGESDADTVYAPTSHMYFDLSGCGKGCFGTDITIYSDRYLPVGADLIPAGGFAEAEGIYDFTRGRIIDRDYDCCFLLRGGESEFKKALHAVYGDISLDIYTDYPSVQLYTGGFLCGGLKKHGGFAAEPEFPPDSPNRKDFPSPVLKKNEKYEKTIKYCFSLS